MKEKKMWKLFWRSHQLSFSFFIFLFCDVLWKRKTFSEDERSVACRPYKHFFYIFRLFFSFRSLVDSWCPHRKKKGNGHQIHQLLEKKRERFLLTRQFFFLFHHPPEGVTRWWKKEMSRHGSCLEIHFLSLSLSLSCPAGLSNEREDREKRKRIWQLPGNAITIFLSFLGAHQEPVNQEKKKEELWWQRIWRRKGLVFRTRRCLFSSSWILCQWRFLHDHIFFSFLWAPPK